MPPIRYLTLVSAAVGVAIASLVTAGAAHAGGGCRELTTDAHSATVTLRRNCFAAAVTRVDEGATVTFTNEDDVAHNVVGAGSTWAVEVILYRDDSAQHTFEENGVYVYSCLLHPGMVGAIVVGDGSGPGLASTFMHDEPGGSLGVGSPAQASQGASDASASNAATEGGGVNATMIAGVIAGGILLLAAIAGGAMALASGSRRAAVR